MGVLFYTPLPPRLYAPPPPMCINDDITHRNIAGRITKHKVRKKYTRRKERIEGSVLNFNTVKSIKHWKPLNVIASSHIITDLINQMIPMSKSVSTFFKYDSVIWDL